MTVEERAASVEEYYKALENNEASPSREYARLVDRFMEAKLTPRDLADAILAHIQESRGKP